MSHGRISGNAHGDDAIGVNAAGPAEGFGVPIDTFDHQSLKPGKPPGGVRMVYPGENVGSDGGLGIVKGGFAQDFSGAKVHKAEHYPGGSQIHRKAGDGRRLFFR
jgi:hypothetical protein